VQRSPGSGRKAKAIASVTPTPNSKLDEANNRIFLPKLGWLRYRNSRDVAGAVRNVTVSLSGGKWFVSVQTAREVDAPIPQASNTVGIDVGIARFATFSDGTYLAPLNSFRKHEARLRRYQRVMSRKIRFSSNWKKARSRIQRIHARIGNARRDYLHKATSTISQNHAMVSIEDLQVRNMSRSSAGTTELPGKNVRAKSGLNKAILDQGWFEFRRQLEYKLTWTGGYLIAVPPHNTSRTCPCCGHVSVENRTKQALFRCVACAYENHADVVGAINVLERGQRLFACGGMVQSGHPAKQEPPEATVQLIA
jgi:putative transposase